MSGSAYDRAELGRPTRGLRNGLLAGLTSGAVAVAVALFVVVGSPAAYAADPAVGLGTATPFAVLAGTTVTNTGPTLVSGDLGVSPGTAITGFPPGQVVDGAQHSADAVALQAQNDLTTAYNDAAGRTPAGTVTLDAQGDPSTVFNFQAGSTLTTATASTVVLTNGAQACNVFWQVGSSATIAKDTTFNGTVMALKTITVQTRASVAGRLLARDLRWDLRRAGRLPGQPRGVHPQDVLHRFTYRDGTTQTEATRNPCR